MTARPGSVSVRPGDLDVWFPPRQAGRMTTGELRDTGPERPWTPVDPLGGVLADLRIRGTFYCRAEVSAPWGL